MFRSALSETPLNAAPRAGKVVARPVLARGYHEKVISHYERPRNVCTCWAWALTLSDNFSLKYRWVPSPRTTLMLVQALLERQRKLYLASIDVFVLTPCH